MAVNNNTTTTTTTTTDDEFPCSLTIDVPFPTPRLASVAHRALAVDQELSPLVRRTFFVDDDDSAAAAEAASVLHVYYKATTNRMLRVAVNGLMESLNLVVEVMEELDVDVLEHNRDNQ
ncbi:transcription factor Pcc1 [Colletotrichum graminicola]|uniref:Transcription factor Pcc1 n=1 Tax=Colletotrichum graminicola (strain M1.001 / M2 / FGSC 10212) TaxID=645133 RepID=E3QEN4_COLGM|nr:transcription factor Pcc1 [Colletotrichum graminicola M1.001]EFQ29340.1 transcription factor Pcc1 [Colletotrichum graminicola M1.001]WDK13792.1 transcription factor Pcc1 [Colletotrichum graminicola]